MLWKKEKLCLHLPEELAPQPCTLNHFRTLTEKTHQTSACLAWWLSGGLHFLPKLNLKCCVECCLSTWIQPFSSGFCPANCVFLGNCVNHGETKTIFVTEVKQSHLRNLCFFQEHVVCLATYLAFGKSKVSGPVVG